MDVLGVLLFLSHHFYVAETEYFGKLGEIDLMKWLIAI